MSSLALGNQTTLTPSLSHPMGEGEPFDASVAGPGSELVQRGGCGSLSHPMGEGQGEGLPAGMAGERDHRQAHSVSAANQSFLTSAATETNDWLLWQLADSAFPTGGFAHSAGLEAAGQHGEVRGRDDLVSFLETSLHQLGRGALPFATAAFREPRRLSEFDRLCDAFTTNHVANRASRLQGKALLSAVERIFTGHKPIRPPDPLVRDEPADETVGIPFSHFGPVFGASLRRLEISRETTMRLFFFQHLRGMLAAAVRLNIVGPMEAQAIQHRLASRAEAILTRCQALTLDDLAQTTPLLDLWQGAHDRLYSRLFQS